MRVNSGKKKTHFSETDKGKKHKEYAHEFLDIRLVKRYTKQSISHRKYKMLNKLPNLRRIVTNRNSVEYCDFSLISRLSYVQ